MPERNVDLVNLTAQIVASYAASNSVTQSDLTGLIASVHLSLTKIGAEPEPPVEALVPAVPIKKSITPDYIICLEDGRKFKTLRRHLRTAYNLSPEEYREKWSLPADYPMVAPAYAETRSQLAKSLGLGRKPAPDNAKRARGKASA
ncbi:MucR family transcriptional regulator [Bosea sp. NPDC055594]